MKTQPLLLALVLAGNLPALEPPIAGRTQSRAQVVLSHDTEVIREMLAKVPLHPKTVFEVEEASNLSEMLGKLQIGRPATPPSSDEMVAPGLPADFEKFKASLNQSTIYHAADGTPALLPGGGLSPVTYYFVEEDIALDELDLTLFHEQAVALSRSSGKGNRTDPSFATTFTSPDPSVSPLIQTPLRAATEFGKVVRWVPGSTLRYCVLKWTFGADTGKYTMVRDNMKAACEDWSSACNIKFEHVTSLDNVPFGTLFPVDDHGKRKVLFVVARQDIGSAFARAFFPNDPIHKRLLLVDPEEYFATSINKTGILRHELGHVLGCRHEHISPDAPVWTSAFCTGESTANSKPITGYNRASVMHYPCEAGLGSGPLPANLELKITELDRIGIQAVYGPPGGTPTGNLSFRDFDPSN